MGRHISGLHESQKDRHIFALHETQRGKHISSLYESQKVGIDLVSTRVNKTDMGLVFMKSKRCYISCLHESLTDRNMFGCHSS